MAKKDRFLPSDKPRDRLVKKKSKSSSKYGKNPSERTVEELLNNCFINLDKPEGPTSHQVDSWVKKILNNDKIGHGGTLDPNATGVLPIGVGEAVKSLHFLLPGGKEYVGVMKLHSKVDEKLIDKTCKNMVGSVTQLPPVRSAVKRVRRKRKIYYFEVLEIIDKDVLFRVGCESGTYVRTLAVDIGKKLRTRAHLSDLRRTRVGHIREEDCVYLQDVKDAFWFYENEKNDEYLKEILQPVENMLGNLPKIIIRDTAVDSICHGSDLAIPGIAELDTDIKKDQQVLVQSLKGEAVSVVKMCMSTEDIISKDTGVCGIPQRVIMKPGIYPSVWKKH